MMEGAAATSATTLPPGVWHVYDLDMDHFAVCGPGPFTRGCLVDEFWDSYVCVRECFPKVRASESVS